jgi:arylsulfatase A-like enzyme
MSEAPAPSPLQTSLMKKTVLVLGMLLMVATSPSAKSQGSAAAAQPNFILILADDLGYHDVGYNGSEEILTPNIDALARNGVVMENGYVTHPYCGPSRAGLITTYSPYDLHSGLPPTEKTFGSRMQTAGYRTGIIGKWHLGASPPFHPNNRGFEYFFGFLSGGHQYFPEFVNTTLGLLLPDGHPHYSANEGGFLPLVRNNNTADFNEYLTTALSRDAARFVKESDKPFCLYLAYNAPHGPLQAPANTIRKYEHIEGWQRRTYAAMIDEMDQGIGMVLEALKASGKFENTLIWFLSDNGGPHPKPGYENESWANNFPFKKGKGSMHEGGSHVPFLLHWPAVLKPGSFSGLVSSLDFTATAVALGGGDGSGPALDGVNLIPYLTGKKKGSPHQALFWRTNADAFCVRTPTAKYLLENWGTGERALYDMLKDPYEQTNLYGTQPETRAELARLWNDWNEGNAPNVLLQAGDYQKKRLSMYKELHEQLKARAAGQPQKRVE